MADQPAPAETKSKRGTMITLVLVLGVALIEGGVFFVLMKYMGGGPSPTYGEETHAIPEELRPEETRTVEIELVERFRVPNNKSGQTIIYEMDASAVVRAARQAEMEEFLAQRTAEVADRIAQILRQASARVMEEDDLGTLKLLLRQGLSELIGDDALLQAVLIPRLVPLPVD